MNDISYVIGRLQGLNELVKILKDLVDKKGAKDDEVITVITDHISTQLNSILSEFDNLDAKPKHKEVLMELKEKHVEPKSIVDEAKEEAAAAPPKQEAPSKGIGAKEQLEQHEKTVDDLLKDLETLKTQ